jgi:hypothetical protein
VLGCHRQGHNICMPRQMREGLCHPSNLIVRHNNTFAKKAHTAQHAFRRHEKALAPGAGHWAVAAWGMHANKHPEIHHNTHISSRMLAPTLISQHSTAHLLGLCLSCPCLLAPCHGARFQGGQQQPPPHTHTDRKDHCNLRSFQNHYQRAGSAARRP